MPTYAVLDDPIKGPAIIKDLAQAVINQAVRDLINNRYELQLDAVYFLAGDSLPPWLAAAIGENPGELIDAGVNMLANARKRLETKGKKCLSR